MATNIAVKAGYYTTKNPSRQGAFVECEKACPRPSERFMRALKNNPAFENIASVDAGTSRHCLRQFSDVMDSLLKLAANDNSKIIITTKAA